MRQVERKPGEPWLVRIRDFLRLDPVDGIGGLDDRCKGGRRDAGQRSDGRCFGAPLVGRVRSSWT